MNGSHRRPRSHRHTAATFSWLRRLLGGPLIYLPVLASSQTLSQTAQSNLVSTGNSESAQPQEVVITGSRLQGDVMNSPQDVKVYSREQIDLSGASTVSQFVNTLPEASLSITENGFQSLSGTTTVQLRGLPVGTTLLLLDGRRVGTSGAAQAYGLTYFDLNTIPLAAVDRIEVVSQGSSAVYGSDAIAGVVNIVPKAKFSGLQANARYGFATGTHEDEVDVAWGGTWDKASLLMVGSYLTRAELPAYGRALTSDNNYEAYGGRNADFYMCPDQANVYALGGGNLPGLAAPYAAVPAGYTGAPSRQEFAATAGLLNRCSLFKYVSLIPGSERAGVVLRGTYQPVSGVELYSNLLLSHTQQFGHNAPPIMYGAPGFQLYTVSARNPFNPFGEPVGVSDMVSALGRETQDLRTNYLNAVLGARGTLPASWDWDIGVSDSEDHTLYTQTNWDTAKVRAALASADTATALNPFVAAPPGSPALLASLITGDHVDSLGRAMVITATLRGRIPALPAGLAGLAVGGEYERDTLFQDRFYYPGPTQRTNFHRNSDAFFAEARIPVLAPRSATAAQDLLDVTVAGRRDHDDQFGSQLTPQFGVELRPSSGLLLRASYSKAFRAPDLIDLYALQAHSDHAVVLDPLRGDLLETVGLTTGGNPSLRPERGLARSFGFLYSGTGVLEGLRVSVTHWHLAETSAIQKFPAQVIVDNAALFPGAVTRAQSCAGAQPCPIVAVNATYQNFGRLDLAGLDYQVAFARSTRIGALTPSLTASQTYRYQATLAPASRASDGVSIARDTGNWAPRWKGTAALNWAWLGWSAYLGGRYVGRYQDYDLSRMIGNFWTVDANLTCKIGRAVSPGTRHWQELDVRLGGVNVLNRLAQFSNFESGFVGYDPTQGDMRGRFLYARVGLRWY